MDTATAPELLPCPALAVKRGEDLPKSVEANPDLDPDVVLVCENAIAAYDLATESPTVVTIMRAVRWIDAMHALLNGSEYDLLPRGFAYTLPTGQTFGMTPCHRTLTTGGAYLWEVQDSLNARCGFGGQGFKTALQAASELARRIDVAIQCSVSDAL